LGVIHRFKLPFVWAIFQVAVGVFMARLLIVLTV